MRIELSNSLDELPRLAEELEQFGESAGLSVKDVMQLNLVLEELVTNTISYGYEGASGPRSIVVELNRDESGLRVVVEDDAREYDPFQRAEPDLGLPLEQKPVGGLGVHLVREIMDECRYERVDGHNRLILNKVVGS